MRGTRGDHAPRPERSHSIDPYAADRLHARELLIPLTGLTRCLTSLLVACGCELAATAAYQVELSTP
jgi:hypothetical protein